MRAARIFLILMAIMSVGLGVLYLFWPLPMTEPMGFGPLAPSATTDVRATYGGFQIATGLFMFWCLRSDRIQVGILLALLTAGAIAASRAIGLIIDGAFTDALKGAMTFEIVVTAISLFLFVRTRAGSQSDRVRVQ